MNMYFVFFNGDFIPFEEAKIPITDKGFLFGQAIFTTILVKDAKAYFLQSHIKRIKSHCKKMNIPFPLISLESLKKLIKKNKANIGSYRLKVIVTAGSEYEKGAVLITLEKEEPLLKKSLELCVYKKPTSFPPLRIKSLVYYDRFVLREFAQKHGFDDCVTFDANQYLLEASVANIFWIKNKTLYFPSPRLLYFRGIILVSALVIARKLKLKIQCGNYTVKDLHNANLFYCNNIMGILPVKSLKNVSLDYDQNLQSCFLNQYSLFANCHAVDLKT